MAQNLSYIAKQEDSEIDSLSSSIAATDARIAALKAKKDEGSFSPVAGAKDVVLGAVTGINRGISEMLKTGQELFTQMPVEDDFLGIGSASKGFSKDNPSTTEIGVGKYKMGTQELVAPIAQFMTAFIPIAGATGKVLKVAGAASKLATGARIAKVGVDSAGAMGVGTDPYEAGLANLIQAAPALANPVTAYLAADPKDGPGTARTKKAVEGLVAGVLGEGAALAFMKTLKFMKARGAAKLDNPQAVEAIDAEMARLKGEINGKEAPAAKEAAPIDAELANSQAMADSDSAAREAYRTSTKQLPAPDERLALPEPKALDAPEVIELPGPASETLALPEPVPLTEEDIFHRLREAAGKFEAPEAPTIAPPSEIRGTPANAAASFEEKTGIDQWMPDLPEGHINLGQELDFGIPEVAPSESLIIKPTGIFGTIQKLRGPIGSEGGAVSVGLQTQIAGSTAGAASGAFVDYDGTGAGSWSNIGIGFTIGTAGTWMLRKMLSAGPKEAKGLLDATVKTKLESLAEMETQFKAKLSSGALSEADRGTITKNLETLNSLRNTLESSKVFKSPEALVASIKNASLVSSFKPVLSVSKENTGKFMQAVREGKWSEVSDTLDFNPATQIHPEDAESALQKVTNTLSENFSEEHLKATRGVVGWDSTKKTAESIANDLGMSQANVNSMFKKTKNMDSRFLAAKILMNSTNVKLNTMLEELFDPKNLINGAPSLEKQLAVEQLTTYASAIQAQVKGSQTEIARSLNAMKLQGKVRDMFGNVDLTKVAGIMESKGGVEKNLRALKDLHALLKSGNTVKINRFTRGLQGNPSLRFINELHRAVMLTSPTTHVANTAGNLWTTLASIGENALKETFQGQFSYGETRGMLEALASRDVWEEAITACKEAAKTGQGKLDPLTKLDAAPSHAISYDNFKQSTVGRGIDYLAHAMGADGALQNTIDAAGNIIRTPFNALTAEDELFKTLNFRMGLHKYAYEDSLKRATMEGLSGKDLYSRAAALKAELVETPTEDLFNNALHHAQVMTFQNPLEGFMGGVSRAVNGDGTLSQLSQLVIPFTKTPANLAQYVFDRTPLSFASQEVRNAVLRGTTAERAEVLSRWSAGSMMIASGVGLASAGVITGGGGDRDSSNLKIAGKQPYSINAGGKSYSFNRFDPVVSFFGLGADAYEILQIATDENDKRKVMAAMAVAVSNMLTSKTMLKGFADLTRITVQGDSSLEAWLKQLPLSFIPSGLGAVAQEFDPIVRDTASMLDEVKARTPGLSSTLPPKPDIFGEAVTREKLGPDLISPIASTEISKDPVRQLFERLNIDTDKDIKGMKQMSQVDLTPQQHSQWVTLRGTMLKGMLNDAVKDGSFNDRNELPASRQSKQAFIQMLMAKSKANAEKEMLADPANASLAEVVYKNKELLQEGHPIEQQ